MLFPLLNLPILAIENVLINLNAHETIEFSLCSSKCKRIVKSIRYPYTEIHVKLKGCGPCLAISMKEHKCLEWKFQLQNLPRGGKNMWRTIGGIKIKVKLNRNNVVSSTRNPENQVKIVYDYLQEIFNLPVSLLHSYKKQSLHPRYFNITKCEDVWIGSADQIPHEHLRYVIEDAKISRNLLLNMRKNPEFQCDPNTRLSMDELHVEGAQWVNRDIFLSLNCARITFENANLVKNDVEDFISQWYHSDSTRLEWLEMNPAIPVGLNKFQPKPWDPNVRGRYFRIEKWTGMIKNLDCSQGMDIIRNDGLIGTIIYESTILYFVVWHNRFPKLSGNWRI